MVGGYQLGAAQAAKPLTNVANVHVIMAMPNTEYFELILPPERHRWRLVRDLAPDPECYLPAPTARGLGIDLDWQQVKEHTTAVLD